MTTDKAARALLNFTPEVAIKAAGGGPRLYAITPRRSTAGERTAAGYTVTVLKTHGVTHSVEIGPDDAAERTLVEAMNACVAHETDARKARAPVGLVFKPSVFFLADGADRRRYVIDYDIGAFVGKTSYEYPAWVEAAWDSIPIGTWATINDAIAGCEANERAALTEKSEKLDGG